jgi:hypothetical protein
LTINEIINPSALLTSWSLRKFVFAALDAPSVSALSAGGDMLAIFDQRRIFANGWISWIPFQTFRVSVGEFTPQL